MVIPESFKMDHTKVKAPYIRVAHMYKFGNSELVKFDVRFCQPNQSRMTGAAMHSMEHKLAISSLKIFGDNHIDVSPMGCKTGFYWTIDITNIPQQEIESMLRLAIQEAIGIKLEAEYLPTEVNCGSYKYHDEEKAEQYLKMFVEGLPC